MITSIAVIAALVLFLCLLILLWSVAINTLREEGGFFRVIMIIIAFCFTIMILCAPFVEQSS